MTNEKFPTAAQIEQRAYELYLERGGEDGHDVEDWLAAEAELTELVEPIVSSAPKAATVGQQVKSSTAIGTA